MRFLLAYLPLGFWAAAVLMLGTLQLTGTALPSGWDKAAHFVMYGVGGGIAAWTGYVRGPREGVLALGVVLLTGVADELLQTRTVTRQGDIMDWVADATGALIFYLVFRFLLGRGIDHT